MKQIKKFLIIFMFILFISGCVKNNNTITINKDKSMSLESEILISNKLLEENSELLNKDTFEGLNVTIKEVSKDDYVGYSISKNYNNIDDVSKNHGEEIRLNNLYKTALENSNLFKIDKGFFRDVYTANFKYYKRDFESDIDIYDEVDEIEEENTEIEADNETEVNDDDLSYLNDLANLTAEFESVFVVKLPYKAISNNATSVNKNTLKWNLSDKDYKDISFSFPIYNITNIALVGGGLLLLIIIIIIIIVVVKKKKNSKSTLIHKDYDPSIEGMINKSVIIDRSKPSNLEYVLLEEETKKQIKPKIKKPSFYDPSKYVDEELDLTDDRVKIDVPDAISMKDINKHKPL